MSLESPSSVQVPAGWYRDPLGGGLRYWDGIAWTEHREPDVVPDEGPVATTGDWIAGAVLSLFLPLIGFIAGCYYAARGGQRARCGYMCMGLSVVAFLVMFAFDPFDYFRPEPGTYP